MRSNTEVRAKASARELQDLPAQLAALAQMSVGELAEKYRELYGEPTRSRNKDYLRKRLAWRIQEQVEGGLPKDAITRIAALGDGLPERWRMRQAAAHSPAAPEGPRRDPRIPPVGTVVRRIYNGAAHEVTVAVDGFVYAQERFKTLSAVAKHITGTPWNGFTFWGLTKPIANATGSVS